METRILELVRSTPHGTLREAWGVGDRAVAAAKNGKRPLMFTEVWALSKVNGMRMSDVLRGPFLDGPHESPRLHI